jgi:hypothetical protein
VRVFNNVRGGGDIRQDLPGTDRGQLIDIAEQIAVQRRVLAEGAGSGIGLEQPMNRFGLVPGTLGQTLGRTAGRRPKGDHGIFGDRLANPRAAGNHQWLRREGETDGLTLTIGRAPQRQ